jgi:hypothetical protein
LKTGELHGSAGSNPALSSNQYRMNDTNPQSSKGVRVLIFN